MTGIHNSEKRFVTEGGTKISYECGLGLERASLFGCQDVHKHWWQAAIEAHSTEVRAGLYGVMRAEWMQDDGWMDGIAVPHFVLDRPGSQFTVAKVCEGGVYQKMGGGGWGLLHPVVSQVRAEVA